MKKKVVWGTGFLASKYVKSLKVDDIVFFIDSNKDKRGTEFLGRVVKGPDDIEDWGELCVYIQHNYYDEVAEELIKKGLVEGQTIIRYEETIQGKTVNVKEECEKSLQWLKKHLDEFQQKTVCWCDEVAHNRGHLDYFSKMCKEKFDWILVSDAVWVSEEETSGKSPFPFFILASICSCESYPEVKSEDFVSNEHVQYVKSNDRLRFYSEFYRTRFPEIRTNYEYEYVYYLHMYMSEVINLIKPKRIFIRHSFSVMHGMLSDLCRKNHIPVIFTHAGVLYGTYAYDINGEMGESLPATHSRDFMNLPVTEDEINKAQQVREYILTHRVNRKIQPKTKAIEKIKDSIVRERPTIFLAGQNDCAAGLVPYTEHSRKYHSPIFSSSIDSAIYFGKIAQERGWNLIFKPHPMVQVSEEKRRCIPENVIFIEQGDVLELIDISDVTVTILSSTAYDALLRYRPVVMVGYNQLKDKGCTYDAFEKDMIVPTIESAVRNGFTEEQQKAFAKHIAQLLKYYLYDDMQERELRYGRQIPQTIDELYELSDLFGEKSIEK